MSKHTPGPWKIIETINDMSPEIQSDDYHVASIPETVWGKRNSDYDESRANAHLITAAPKMFDKLIELRNEFQSMMKIAEIKPVISHASAFEKLVNELDEIIAEAEGKDNE